MPEPRDRLGWGRWSRQARVAAAWAGLLIAGLSPALTGPLTWPIAGYEVFGEYVIEFLALGLAGFVLLACGLRTPLEIATARGTILLALVTPITAAWSDRWFWSAELAMHIALALQLAAWLRATVQAREGEAWPVGVMMAAMAVEAGNIAAKLLIASPDCLTGMWLTCVSGSTYAPMALPLVATLAMLPWFAGLTRWNRAS